MGMNRIIEHPEAGGGYESICTLGSLCVYSKEKGKL